MRISIVTTVVLVLLAGTSWGAVKIAPTQAEAGHPFTIIDTSQSRLIDGSVAVFKSDGLEFLRLAAEIPIRAEVETYPLEQANQALRDLREGALEGSAVLVP